MFGATPINMQLIEFTTLASGAAARAARLSEVLAEERYLCFSDTTTCNIFTVWENDFEFLGELQNTYGPFPRSQMMEKLESRYAYSWKQSSRRSLINDKNENPYSDKGLKCFLKKKKKIMRILRMELEIIWQMLMWSEFKFNSHPHKWNISTILCHNMKQLFIDNSEMS